MFKGFDPDEIRRISEQLQREDPISRDQVIDSQAAILELAETCKQIPHGVITGMTSASIRGWTTANTFVRIVALPPNLTNTALPKDIVPIPCPLLPQRVELRTDQDGGSYRLADPVRTVADAIRYDSEQVQFHVEEVVRAALDDGVRADDVLEFVTLGEVPEFITKAEYYLSLVNPNNTRTAR